MPDWKVHHALISNVLSNIISEDFQFISFAFFSRSRTTNTDIFDTIATLESMLISLSVALPSQIELVFLKGTGDDVSIDTEPYWAHSPLNKYISLSARHAAEVGYFANFGMPMMATRWFLSTCIDQLISYIKISLSNTALKSYIISRPTHRRGWLRQNYPD